MSRPFHFQEWLGFSSNDLNFFKKANTSKVECLVIFFPVSLSYKIYNKYLLFKMTCSQFTEKILSLLSFPPFLGGGGHGSNVEYLLCMRRVPRYIFSLIKIIGNQVKWKTSEGPGNYYHKG